MKLVINSNVQYDVPLNAILESLLKVGWTDWTNVIVVRGGANQDCLMTRMLRDFTYIDSTVRVLVCDIVLENFDYHGLVVLQRYKTHPGVGCDWYFYVLDTVTFEDGFVDCFSNFIDARKGSLKYDQNGRQLSTMFSCKLPNSNICVFNTALVDAYGSAFETQKLTKKEAMDLECGRKVGHIKPLPAYAKNKQPLQQRKWQGTVDRYKTGFERDIWFYPDMCVYKYILWGMAGDLSDNGAFTY